MRGRIVIAGGSGLIGKACRDHFGREGYDVAVLTRRNHTEIGEVSWDPDRQWIADNVLDGAAAVINLCGLSLDGRRWTSRYKELLLTSRVVPTHFLEHLIGASMIPPACYIGISGTGIYGDQGTNPVFDDSDMSAQGFVPDLVKAWEQAHQSIPHSRNVILRTGVVVTSEGGFLKRLMFPTRFGMYPYFGNGRQLLSWIHIADLTRLILHCLRTTSVDGIYHATAPVSIPLRELMKTLKAISRRPGILFSIPRVLMNLGLGEMALLLFESADVRPNKIMSSGFQHAFPDMRAALQEEFSK